MSRALTVMASVLIVGLVLTGCATVLQGTSQSIMVDSDPRGATVFVDGQQRGITPTSFTLQKGRREQVIRVEHDGYRVQQRPLTTSYDPVAILNIFWDLSTTDLITGAAWQYQPNSYFFRLDPQ